MVAKRRSKTDPKPKAPAPAKPATVATLTAVAKHFGVNRRTVADWKNEGAPLAAAPFNLEAIDVWHRAHTAKSQATQQTPKRAEYQERILAADARRAEHELDKLLGQSLSKALSHQLYERGIAEAKNILQQMADEILGHFPRIKPKAALRLTEVANGIAERVCGKLADAHEAMARELEV